MLDDTGGAGVGVALALVMAAVSCGGIAVVDGDSGDPGSGGSTPTAGPGPTTGSGASGAGGGPSGVPGYVTASCPEVGGWQTVCLTTAYPAEIRVFELETGEECLVGGYEPFGSSTNGLALFGDHIVFCDEGLQGIARVHVPSGATETAPVPCLSATDSNGKLVVQRDPGVSGPGDSVVIADDYDAFVASNVVTTMVFPFSSRIAARGTDLYAAWHSTNELELWNLETGDGPQLIALQDFDDWVIGMSPMGDGRIVVLSTNRVVTFAASGAQLATLPMSIPLGGGLRCWE